MRLALLCIALLSCSTLSVGPPAYPVWPYVTSTCTVASLEKKFQVEMAAQGILITEMVHAKLVDKLHACDKDPLAIGCTSYEGGTKIELLRSFWDRVDCGWREALVFHEHGHADLLLGHQSDALMDPFVEGGYACLLRNRNKCLEQMASAYKIMLLFRYAPIHIL